MQWDRKNARFAYMGIDIVLIACAFYLSYSLRYNRFFFSLQFPNLIEHCLLFLLWGLSLVFFLYIHRLYLTNRSLTIPEEALRVAQCVLYSAILAGLAIFLLQLKFFSRLIFGWSTLLLLAGCVLWRAAKRMLVRYLIVQGHLNIHVLVVGAGKAGISLAQEISRNPYLGLQVVGFLDDAKKSIPGYPVLGTVAQLSDVVRQYYIDEIFVSIPSERKLVSEVLLQARTQGKSVRVLADTFTFLDAFEGSKEDAGLQELVFSFPQLRLDFLGHIPLIAYADAAQHGTERYIKRLLDMGVSALCLFVLMPLFLLIAFVIKLDSPGPVFYKQVRCGKKGKKFMFYKFRSMVEDADTQKASLRHRSEVSGPIFKMKNDPRVTRMGRFLRKYSLDDLPKLFNVVKGDMSLVGPRPPTPDELIQYELWQMRRLEVRPGITGLWQVRGRSDLSFYKWMKWDMWYIDNWSFRLDLRILLWTIPSVLKGKGAY